MSMSASASSAGSLSQWADMAEDHRYVKCPECIDGWVVHNPLWPSGDGPHLVRCEVCSGNGEVLFEILSEAQQRRAHVIELMDNLERAVEQAKNRRSHAS